MRKVSDKKEKRVVFKLNPDASIISYQSSKCRVSSYSITQAISCQTSFSFHSCWTVERTCPFFFPIQSPKMWYSWHIRRRWRTNDLPRENIPIEWRQERQRYCRNQLTYFITKWAHHTGDVRRNVQVRYMWRVQISQLRTSSTSEDFCHRESFWKFYSSLATYQDDFAIRRLILWRLVPLLGWERISEVTE